MARRLVIALLCIMVQLEFIHAQSSTCNATTEQPVVMDVTPPSGTTGQDAGLSSIYTVRGELLDSISRAEITILTTPTRLYSLTLQNRMSTAISFRIPQTSISQSTSGGTPATLVLFSSNPACQNVSISLTVFSTVLVILGVQPVASPGTTIATTAVGSCLPDTCGDNSTTFGVEIGGITLERLNRSTSNPSLLTARFPNFDVDSTMSGPTNVFVLVTQYQRFQLQISLNFALNGPGAIQSVVPSQGQRGTRVTITGSRLLGDGLSLSLSRVLLGETPAEISRSNQSTIQIRVGQNGQPGNVSITINTTQALLSGQLFDGPYTFRDNAWTQLEDGLVRDIVPPAAQPGRTILLCGDRLLGGGSTIDTLLLADESTLQFNSTPTALVFASSISEECITAVVPMPSGGSTVTGRAVLTADTGAVVESTTSFTFAAINSIAPMRGQPGTVVTISGVALLSGYDSVVPTVYLSGVEASLISYNSTTIAVRAVAPPIGQGSGMMSSLVDLYDIAGDVSIEVTANFTSPTTFSVSTEAAWTYLTPGEINTISPTFGQFGTQIIINGSNLLGYGSSLVRATIGGMDANIESATENVVILSTPNLGSVPQNVTIVLFSDSGAEIRGENLYEYRERGVVMSTQPTNGQNGTYVMITGVNLFGYANNITNVSLGSVQAIIDYTQANNTLIVVRAMTLDNPVDTAVPVSIVASTNAIVTSNGNIWTYLVQGNISTVSPGEGQSGTRIEITGTNLLGGGATVAIIFLDGVRGEVESASSTRIVVIMRDRSERLSSFFSEQVYIMADTGAIVFGGAYTHRDSGQITTFSPQRGRRGTRITLSGVNLLGYGSNVVQVLIAGARGNVESFDNTSATIRAGDSSAGVEGPIQLIINTGAVITSAVNFTYEQSGVISEVVPRMGAEGSGLLIRGTALSPSTSQIVSVTIGGNPVSRIVTAADSEVSVIVGPAPAIDSTNATIMITSEDGSIVDGETFTFISLVISLPGRNSGQEGTYVDIQLPNTANFAPSLSMRVTIDEQESQVTSVNSTLRQITVRAPRARRSGTFVADVAVESLDRLVARLRNGFTYLEEGTIFSIEPSFGQRGTRVVIRGANLLGGGMSIENAMLAGVPANVVTSTNESIQLDVAQNLQSASYPQIGDVILTANSGATIRRLNGFTLVQPGEITAITPTTGQFGTRVTISGTNLLQGTSSDNITSVSLASVPATILGTASQTQIMVQATSADAGAPGPVELTLASGARITSPAGTTFQYLQRGRVDTVVPNSGPVGTNVVITGTNFLGGGTTIAEVILGGVQARITGSSDTQINITAMVGIPGGGDVLIISNTGTTINGSGLWTYEDLGSILRISPTIGQNGVEVTITGQTLLSTSSNEVTECRLAGIPATSISVISRDTVRCVAGPSPNPSMSLTGPVSLTTNTGTTVESLLNVTSFTYYSANIDRVQPANGNNGTIVTITGTNLYGHPGSTFDVQQVLFGSVEAAVVSSTLSSIQVRVGFFDNATSGDTVVVRSTSGAVLSLPNVWNYTQPRSFSEISQGSGIPGDTVYLFGDSLNLPTATGVVVIVGGATSHSARVVNDSTIQFTLGVYQGIASPGQDLDVQVVYSTGETLYNSSVTFTYNMTQGTISSVSPRAGSAQASVTINGTSLLNNQSVARVTLAGVNAVIVNASEERIILEAGTPPAEGSSGPVVIERDDGTIIGLAGNAWTHYPTVMPSDVSPRTGQNGTIVTIDLSRLSSMSTIDRVSLTGILATDINFNTTNRVLSVRAGPSSNQTMPGEITVEFNDNSILSIPNSWNYQPPVEISNVSSSMQGYFNTSIVIDGSNFQAALTTVVSVTLAGVQTSIEAQNNTQLRLRIIELRDTTTQPITGPIVITSSQGATFVSSNSFTYVQVRVDRVTPQMGQRGTRVTVSGVGVNLGGSRVSAFWLGGVEATVISVNDSHIVAAAGEFPMQSNLSDVSYIMDTGAVITIPNSWRYVVPGEILSVTPTEGSMGTLVTIMGNNLFGGGNMAEMVILNSMPAIEIVVNFDSLIQVLAGPSTTALQPGNVQVISDTGAVTESTSAVVFEYLEPGRITTLTPNRGQNGTTVQVGGSYLHNGEGIRRVLLAGVEAEITNIAQDIQTSGIPTTIDLVARRPSSLGAFSGPVVVESHFNTTTVSSSNFTYITEGLILSISPITGQNGTIVTISGLDLPGGGSVVQRVYLIGVEATILSRNQTVITVRAGESRMGGTGAVVLQSDTNAYVERPNAWTYIAQGEVTSVSPQMGQFGTRVTISGQRLLLGASALQSVSFDNISAYDIISTSDTAVSIRVGRPTSTAAFTSNSITFRSISGGMLYEEFTWNFTDASRITEVSPGMGTSLTMVTVNGENLFGGGSAITSVTVAGIPGTIMMANSTMVVFQTGINRLGSNIEQGFIVLESNAGALTESPTRWEYEDDCLPGMYGTAGNCQDCNEQCELCFGPTDLECITCSNFSLYRQDLNTTQCVSMCPNVSTLERECRDACELNQYARVNSTVNEVFCYNCSELCDPNRQCSGPESSQCGACRFFYNTLNGTCVEECPVGTYSNESSSCLPCDSQCTLEDGCTGPSTAECVRCSNVRVSANLIGELSSTPGDICLERCPTTEGLYLDSDTRTCLSCADSCATNCTGPSPFECISCRNNSFVYPDGSRKCVSDCNPDPTMKLYYDDENGICQRCDPRCSNTSGCTGPSPSDCISCATPMLMSGECVISCNRTHYHDTSTNICVACHESCDIGCTGTAPQDCIVADSTAFVAGGGTIALVIIVIIVLVVAITVLTFFLLWPCFGKNRDKYIFSRPSTTGDNIELGERYQPAAANLQSASPAKESKAEGESIGIVNTGFGNEEFYCQAGPEENVVSNVDDAPDVYIDMTRSTGETGSQDLLYTDMSPAPVEPEDVSPVPPVSLVPPVTTEAGPAPARPPKPGEKPKEEKPPKQEPVVYKVPVKSGDDSKPAEKPPLQCPPSPGELYTDMGGGVQEVHFKQDAAASGGLSQDLYDDVQASPPKSPKKQEDRNPLLTPVEDMYEDTDTAVEKVQQYRSSDYQVPQVPAMKAPEQNPPLPPKKMTPSRISQTPLPPLPPGQGGDANPPALPQRPAPKKRISSTPLPQTPLQKSLSGSSVSSPPTSPTSPIPAPAGDDIYEDTAVPVEECLYEPIPAKEHLIAEQPSQAQSKPSKGLKLKGKKKK